MKKFLTLCATFLIMGALFVGCIDNTEPEGVLKIREAIADLLRTKQTLVLAQAEYVRALAAYANAQAESEKALAKIYEQQAAALKLENDYTQGVLQASIAAGIAEYNRFAAEQMYLMYLANANAEIAERQYLLELIYTQEQLRTNKIQALDNIVTKIGALLLEQGLLRNELLAWEARRLHYATAELPYEQRRLEHELEYAGLTLFYSESLYNIWTEIKNLAVSDYVTFAEAVVVPELTALATKEEELRMKYAAEMVEYTKLQDAERNAEHDYRFSGVNTPLTNIAIGDVFDTPNTATDLFRNASKVPISLTDSVDIVTGVYKNTYSFYHTVSATYDPEGAIASLGYLNTLEQLKAEKVFLERNRIFSGYGATLAANKLADMEEEADDAVDAYTKAFDDWKEAYDYVKGGPTWGSYRTTYNTKLTAFNGAYGLKNYAGLTATADQALAAVHAAALFAAIQIPDANQRKAAVAQVPVNYTYFFLKGLIEQYVTIVKAVLAGEFDEADILGAKQISDVLGGITFDPGALFEWVVGKGNAATFKMIVDFLYASAALMDIAEMINLIMPGFYQASENWVGTANYLQGPVFDKYDVTTSWEYHAWFLIYILFENNPTSFGNNIFRINSYDNVIEQLWKDFLGCTLTDYPGSYSYINSPASNAAVTRAHRLSLTGLAFNPNASINNLPAVASEVIDAEDALRAEWNKWSVYLRSVNGLEADMYTPYNRTWTAANHAAVAASGAAAAAITGSATPRWISEPASGTGAVGKPTASPSNPYNVYFRPENAPDGVYTPSLVDGEELYWTNLGPIWTPASSTLTVIPTSYYVNYYPALAIKRATLMNVNWNEWLNQGKPNYRGDLVLWINDWDNSWEDNDNLDDVALLAQTFITRRNFNEFEFWYNQQPNYEQLLVDIQEKIEALEGKVEELRQAWVDASAARILKYYELTLISSEITLANVNYNALRLVYESNLRDGIAILYWNNYDQAFTQYTADKLKYDTALANYDTFMKSWIYPGGGSSSSTWTDYVENKFITIDKNIERVNERLKYIEYELAILESEKEAILKIYSN